MSQSNVSADGRANLIREMARQGDSRTRGSVASSVASDVQSVRDYDTISQQLPSLHDASTTSIKGLSEFKINTSALRRAFPNFSHYGSSEEDSIEVGRGLRSSHRGLPSADVTEDMEFRLGNGGDNYKVTGTPPLKARSTIKSNLLNLPKESGRSTSHKENVDPLAKTTYVSASSSGKGSLNGRHSLAEVHARVESDNSVQLNGGRPQIADKSTRSSRFTAGRSQPAVGTFDTNLGKSVDEQTTQRGMTTDSAVNATGQSFMLPDLPNITELVAGVRADGTPLFNRSSKPRSRFATPSQTRRKSTNRAIHIPIDSVPVPADEKALYLSLQLLQEKVAILEKEKAESEVKCDDYEMEVLQLRSEMEEQKMHRRSDSGLGADVDDAKVRDWQGERSELERSIRTLEDRLERADRKVSVSEITIRNLTLDRDAAHEQLAAAYLNSEELKNESDELQEELENVKADLVRVTRSNEETMERLTQRETELRQKIARRERAVNEMGALAKELWNTRNALAASKHDGVSEAVEKNKTPAKSTLDVKNAASKSKSSPPERWCSTQTLDAKSHDDVDVSDAESTTDIRILKDRSGLDINRELTKDMTFMSFMEGDEVAKLRRIVDADKAKLAQASGAYDSIEQDEQNASKSKTTSVPRKSSFKSLNAQSRNQRVQYEQDDSETQSEAEADADHPTQQSVDELKRSRRSTRTAQPDVTSGFILPDITMRAININPSASTHATTGGTSHKQTITVPRPTPVSERLPTDEDATVRPAQSPAIALAVVLKGFEDEVSVLRTQLAEHYAIYHQHDPSLSKRKRKAVHEGMLALLAAIERRSDEIYALYDVLEGQKESGQLMLEGEVEVTL